MNEEENNYKISIPLVNDRELQTIDSYYNEMIEEFVKQSVKERDQIITQRIMYNLQEENKQLKEKLQQKQDIINNILDYIDSNKFVEQFENVANERNVRNEILSKIERSDK